MKKEDVYVVGIAGGSASGKTTIIEKLKKQFKDEIVKGKTRKQYDSGNYLVL